jgi:hypothetical protein
MITLKQPKEFSMISFTMDGIEYRAFNHLYAVSRCGKVLRKHTPFIPSKHPGGYLLMGKLLVHRIVAECWMDNFNPVNHIHHINGNKTDNRLENLECLSASEHLIERHADMMASLGRYTRTDETREAIRQSRLGKVTSEETKAKQRAALLGRKRPFFNRASPSEASIQQRSETHVRNIKCRINGTEYRSFAQAAIATGIHRFTLRKRCISKNFPDYEIVK